MVDLESDRNNHAKYDSCIMKILGLLAVFAGGMALGNCVLPYQMMAWPYVVMTLCGGFCGARLALGRV